MASYRSTTLERIEFEAPRLKVEKLPLVIDDWTLAFRMGFTGRTLWFALKNRTEMYQVFKIKKASGGMRTIHNPNKLMRLIGKQLRARFLLPLCAELGPHVGAYQVGKGTRDNALAHLAPCPVCAPADGPHTCKKVLTPTLDSYTFTRLSADECKACAPVPKHDCPRRGVKIHMDLKDFFTSTRRSWIRQYFHRVVGYNHYVSGLLAELMTVPFTEGKRSWSGVPQGAVTSGDICNLVADWRLDQPIIASLKGWTYSRYADDLYFSHPENLPREEVDRVIAEIERLVQCAGYRVNRKKLHVQRPRRRQKVLGIVVNQKINIPREEYRKFRSLLNNCLRHGFESQVERAKKESVGELHGWLVGKITYFKMVAPEKGEKLRMIYDFAKQKHSWATDAVAEVYQLKKESA